MWEGLMEATEVIIDILISDSRFAGSGEPGNPAGTGSGLKIGDIPPYALTNWVLSPGKASGVNTMF